MLTEPKSHHRQQNRSTTFSCINEKNTRTIDKKLLKTMISTAKLTAGRSAMMINRFIGATRPGNITTNKTASKVKAMQQQHQRFMSVINISDFEATEKFSQLNHKSVLYFTGVCACICVCVCVCVCLCVDLDLFHSLMPHLVFESRFILSRALSRR